MSVHVSPKYKALVVPNDPAIKNLFPNAKLLEFRGASHLVINHEPGSTFILRKLGYDVPAPILTHYTWTGAYKPFESQRQTCALLTTNERAYVLNGMGTGKTKTPLWAFDYLRGNDSCCGKMLIMAPLSTLNPVWMKEVFNTTPHRKAVVLHGSKGKRLERLYDSDAEIFIINHDGVAVIEKELFAMVGNTINVLCIDELAEFRNPSGRSKLLRKLAGKMRFVWGMTGTPTPKAPTDAWMQATIITPHTVPKYFKHFREDVMLAVAPPHVWAPKPDAEKRVYEVLQPAVRFTLEDVQELPQCVERFIDVNMGPYQDKVYKSMATTCFAAFQGKQITAINAASVMTKLLQVSAGWVYAKDGKTVVLDNSLRIDALIDAIKSTQRKVLVFVPFKHALAGIYEALIKAGVDCTPPVSGDTPESERDRIFNFFQNTTKYQVLPAHPKCCCHGLTLTAADTVVWVSPTADLSIYEQANGRITRAGTGRAGFCFQP